MLVNLTRIEPSSVRYTAATSARFIGHGTIQCEGAEECYERHFPMLMGRLTGGATS